MAVTINADNGVSSGSAGLKQTADSTGVLALQTNGTTAVTVDTSQNVGIGTSSPSYKLDILTGGGGVYAAQFGNGTAAQGMRIVTGMDSTSSGITTAGGTRLIQFDGTNNITQFYTNTSERMRIDSSGNVGIGTTSPSTQLHVSGTNAVLNITRSTKNFYLNPNYANGGSYATFESDLALAFNVNGSERMRIDTSGNLQFNSGYGSVATAYGCRAWVNFNGTGTIAIRASGNVSSLTDNGTGDYTVNFTNAMPDVNYCSLATGTGQVSSSIDGYANIRDPQTEKKVGSVRVQQVANPNAGTPYDTNNMNVAIFR